MRSGGPARISRGPMAAETHLGHERLDRREGGTRQLGRLVDLRTGAGKVVTTGCRSSIDKRRRPSRPFQLLVWCSGRSAAGGSLRIHDSETTARATGPRGGRPTHGTADRGADGPPARPAAARRRRGGSTGVCHAPAHAAGPDRSDRGVSSRGGGFLVRVVGREVPLKNLDENIAHRPLLDRRGHLDSRMEGFRDIQVMRWRSEVSRVRARPAGEVRRADRGTTLNNPAPVQKAEQVRPVRASGSA